MRVRFCSWLLLASVVAVLVGQPLTAAAEGLSLPVAPGVVRTQLRSLMPMPHGPPPSGATGATVILPCSLPPFLVPFDGTLTFRKAYRRAALGAFRFSPQWSHFGLVRGGKRFHGGIDLAATTGTPVRAAVDGVVTYARERDGYGLFARLTFETPKRAEDGTCTNEHEATQIIYAHLLDDDPKRSIEPRTVRAGDVLGRVGCSGNARGMCSPSPESHLHVTVQRVSGSKTRLDPVAFLAWSVSTPSESKSLEGAVSAR